MGTRSMRWDDNSETSWFSHLFQELRRDDSLFIGVHNKQYIYEEDTQTKKKLMFHESTRNVQWLFWACFPGQRKEIPRNSPIYQGVGAVSGQSMFRRSRDAATSYMPQLAFLDHHVGHLISSHRLIFYSLKNSCQTQLCTSSYTCACNKTLQWQIVYNNINI